MGFDPADVSAIDGQEPMTPGEVAELLGAARDHILIELTALGDAGSLAAGAGRMVGERVPRPHHRG